MSRWDSQDLFFGKLSIEPSKDKRIVELLINNHKTTYFKMDYGTQANMMSVKLYNILRAQPLHSSSIWLTTHSGIKLQVHGKCKLESEYQNKKALLEFQVVEFDLQAILGLQAGTSLNLVQSHYGEGITRRWLDYIWRI